MLNYLYGIINLARNDLSHLYKLNIGELFFLNANAAWIVGLAFMAILAISVLLGLRKSKNSQKHTGQIPSGGVFSSPFRFIVYLIRMLAYLSIFIMILALAEPYLNKRTEETKLVESRIRVDLRDISSSMDNKSADETKSKAEVASRAHAEFVKMRAGKNDRVSLWLFSSLPHLVEDFIIDDQNYLYQVEDAPWLTWSSNVSDLNDFYKKNPNYYIPRDRYLIDSSELGGTDYEAILKAVIRQFDSDEESKKAKNKSVLMISDGEPDEFPEQELKALQKRKIVLYIILIRKSETHPTPKNEEEKTSSPQKTANQIPEFARRISSYGGKFFDVVDAEGLRQAFEAIDKMETAEVEVKTWTTRVPLFREFIFAGALMIFFLVCIVLILEPFGVYP
jgi:hypothetical protein